VRVAVVTTYPPRPCGIGIFSHDLRAAMSEADPSTAIDIVSIVRDPVQPRAPEVVAAIRQDVRSDYAAVARTLTSRGTDVVLIEHEYGIFGGEAGAFVLSLVEELEQPLVITLHTVLSAPSVRQAEALRALCHRATLVTVFTETARRMVLEARIVPPERVRVLPHGAPSILLATSLAAEGKTNGDQKAPRPALERLEGRTVLSTFGLISAGKGIELAISALPPVVAAHPDVLYLVAGQTHPEVVKRDGEKYRLRLERLVRDLGLIDHVHFLDRFLTEAELAVLLASTDLYLTPYRSREQIVSGALTFAVAAGCPVVSTPYFYAEDLLSSGAGVLVPFEDPAALSDAVLDLLGDRVKLQRARAEARRVGSELAWPSVGAATLGVLGEALDLGRVPGPEPVLPPLSAPGIRPDHLLNLVDDVGIIQHADGVVANRDTGYCVDDVARLVVVALGLSRQLGDQSYRRMLASGLAFLRHAWDPAAAGMRNFMGYDRRWLDDPHSGDHVGRAAWALGEVVAAQPPRPELAASLRLLEQMLPALEASQSPRGVAFTLLGLSRIDTDLLSTPLQKLLRNLGDRLLGWYDSVRTDDWRWFEDILAYDNARLPQALIAAGHRLDVPEWLDAGIEALDWYAAQSELDSASVRLVGNLWRHRTDHVPADDGGDEQPLEAAALVEALVEALAATGRHRYGQQAVQAFEWYLGRNRLGVPVYDFSTGGCHDGLGSDALNENQGAESTLSFLQALLALDGAGLQSSLPRL
jgi:glycosyltransferase involved in cell wall biosynthesis